MYRELQENKFLFTTNEFGGSTFVLAVAWFLHSWWYGWNFVDNSASTVCALSITKALWDWVSHIFALFHLSINLNKSVS